MKKRFLIGFTLAWVGGWMLTSCDMNGGTEPEEIAAPRIVAGPTVSNIDISLAELRWQTDVVANSIVRYGTVSGSYEKIVQSTEKEKSHFLALTSLNANTTYYYIAESENAGGKISSPEGEFTTKKTIEMIFEQAWNDYAEGQYQQAIRQFRQLVESSSSFYEAYLGLGWCYAASPVDSLQKSKFNFSTAISFQGDLTSAYAGRGFVNMALELSHEAIADFLMVLQLDEDFVFERDSEINNKDVRLGLAELYFYQQKFSLAQEQVDVLKPDNGLNADDSETWVVNGTAYGSYAESLLALIETLKSLV